MQQGGENYGKQRVLVNTFDELESKVLDAWREPRHPRNEEIKVPKIYPIGPIEVVPATSLDRTAVQESEDSGNRSLRWLASQPPCSVLYVAFGSWLIILQRMSRGLPWLGEEQSAFPVGSPRTRRRHVNQRCAFLRFPRASWRPWLPLRRHSGGLLDTWLSHTCRLELFSGNNSNGCSNDYLSPKSRARHQQEVRSREGVGCRIFSQSL